MYICIFKRFQTSTCFGVLNFALNLPITLERTQLVTYLIELKNGTSLGMYWITILEKDFASIAEAERDGNNNNPCGRPTRFGVFWELNRNNNVLL